MAFLQSKVYSSYLEEAVALTVEGFGGVSQHLQNLLWYRDTPSAVKFLDVELQAGRVSIWADLHNAPSWEDVRKYVGSLGNKPGAVVAPGANQMGHGGKAGFQADAKVGVLGAKAGDLYMLGFPLTSGMREYMKANPLKLGVGAHAKVYDGDEALDPVVFLKRVNGMDKANGIYDKDFPQDVAAVVDKAHYLFSLDWLDDFLKSVGSSLPDVYAAAFDKLKGVNGLCIHYLVQKDGGFVNQTFSDGPGVLNDIVIPATMAGEPPLRLSHEISDQFDCNALLGRVFRINGQVLDMRPLCPTAQPVIKDCIPLTLADGKVIKIAVHSNADVAVPIDCGAVVWKLGGLLLPEVNKDLNLEAVRGMLNNDARFPKLVDKKRGAVSRDFLKALLHAASAAPAGNDLPWQTLRTFVKDVSELDTEQSAQGLKFLRHVFGLDYSFLVADIGTAFTTNNNKTGVNDSKAETKKVMQALPDIWMALASNLPKDYEAVLSDFRARREAAHAASKAAKAKDAAAAAAAAAEKAAAAAAAAAPGGGAGGDGGEQPLGRAKRKAAVQAVALMAGVDNDDAPELIPPPPPPPKKPKAKPAASASAAAHPALLAENNGLKARVAALEAEVASLKAQLAAAGLVPN